MRAALVLLVACSNAPAMNQTAPDGTKARSDGPAGSPMDGAAIAPTSTLVSCTTGTRTVVNADGSKTVDTLQYALLDVGGASNFAIASCNERINGTLILGGNWACGSGQTCTPDANWPPDPTNLCTWDGGADEYFDGKLYAFCGNSSQGYNAMGSAVGNPSTTTFDSVTLYTW